jgi:TolB-like protein
MSDSSSFLSRLTAELKRRKVPQVAVAYLAVAAAVIGTATAAVQVLYLPERAATVIVLLCILGFPIVVVLSWAFDLTPEGVRRTEEAEADTQLVLGRPSRIALLGLTVLVTAFVGAAFWEFHLKGAAGAKRMAAAAAPAPLDPSHVAVLYLDDISQKQDLGYLAEGLTQTLINELGNAGINVVSMNGVKPFRHASLPIDSIGRILRAGSVVGGTVQGYGDSLRVSVQLVDATTGDQLGSVEVHGSSQSQNLFALQDSVSSEVARSLRQRLGKEVELINARQGAHDPQAWKVYQRAIGLRDDADSLRLVPDTAGAMERYDRADSLLGVAAQLDPKWILPTVERGWTALNRARVQSPVLTETDTTLLREGIGDANRILAKHPDEPTALELRGNLEWFLSKATSSARTSEDALKMAEADLRMATTTEPGLSRAWAVLAYIVKDQGKFEEAKLDARRMAEADPYLSNNDIYAFLWASVALELGEIEKADSLLARAEEQYPRVPAYLGDRLLIVASRPTSPGAVDRAWALLHRIEDLLGRPYQSGRFYVAATLARAGLADSAEGVARRARKMDPNRALALKNEAYVALQLGDRDRTLQLLGQYLQRVPLDRAYTARDWWWDSLHGDPRFQALVDTAAAAAN